MKLTITNKNTAQLTFKHESTPSAIQVAILLRDSKNVFLGDTDRKSYVNFKFNMSESEFKALYEAAKESIKIEFVHKFEREKAKGIWYNIINSKNGGALQCKVHQLKTMVYELILNNKIIKCFKDLHDLHKYINKNWDNLDNMQPMSDKEIAEYYFVANQFDMYIPEDGAILPLEDARCFSGYTYEHKEEIKKVGIFKFDGLEKQWYNPDFEYPTEYGNFEIETWKDPQLGWFYNYHEKNQEEVEKMFDKLEERKVEDFVTDERISSRQGSFTKVSLSQEEMEALGYSYQHSALDHNHIIMGNGKKCYAVAIVEIEKQAEEQPVEQVEPEQPVKTQKIRKIRGKEEYTTVITQKGNVLSVRKEGKRFVLFSGKYEFLTDKLTVINEYVNEKHHLDLIDTSIAKCKKRVEENQQKKEKEMQELKSVIDESHHIVNPTTPQSQSNLMGQENLPTEIELPATQKVFGHGYTTPKISVKEAHHALTNPQKELTVAETIMQYHKDEAKDKPLERDYDTLYLEFGTVCEVCLHYFKDLLPTIYCKFSDSDLNLPIYRGYAGEYNFYEMEVFAEQEELINRYEYPNIKITDNWTLQLNGDIYLGDELIFQKI